MDGVVQTVTSIAAAVTAVLVAWRQSRREAREDERGELDLVVLMRKAARDEVHAVQEEVAKLRDQVAKLERGLTESRTYVIALLTAWRIHLPDQPPPAPPESLGIPQDWRP